MKALLLAAGFGTRLGETTKNLPKCLVKVGNHTMLDHWLYKLTDLGVTDFVINTHYLSNQVEKFISHHPLQEKITLSYEPKLLGTGRTVLAHSNFLKSAKSFIVHVDNFCQDSLHRFIVADSARPIETLFSMLTFTTKTPENCGIVEVDSSGRLISFHEKQAKQPSNKANGAVYLVSPEFFDEIKKIKIEINDFSSDIIPNFIGKVFCYHTDGYFEDIGSERSLSQARLWNERSYKNQFTEKVKQ